MADSVKKENTPRRRPEPRPLEISDADYVAREDAPSVPWTGDYARQSAGPSASRAVLALLACLTIFAAAVIGTLPRAPVWESAPPDQAGGANTAAPRPAGTARTAADGEARLGLVTRTVTPWAAEYYNDRTPGSLVPGAQVYALDSDGPAAAAGLRRGDVITGWDEEAIASAEDVDRAERNGRPGEGVTLTVYREGEYLTVAAVLQPGTVPDGDDFFHSLDHPQ